LLQVGKFRTIGIECSFTSGTFREWIYDKSGHTAGMDLEVKPSSNRILPELYLR
jgi:hypothetical protein